MLFKDHEERFNFMYIGMVLIFAVLVGRMAFLQLYRGAYYMRQSEGNRVRDTKIIAPRGIIYDCNGEKLAVNRPSFVVSFMQTGRPIPREERELLKRILEMENVEMDRALAKGRDSYEPIRIKRNITPRMLTLIEENKQQLPDVMLEVVPIREYINDGLAVHTVGYVGEISEYEISKGIYKGLKEGSIVGKFGLESFYDKLLRGVDGSYREEVDVNGRLVQILNRQEPQAGHDLVLTIDAKLQRVVEDAVDRQLRAINAQAGAVVVMDANNGEIKAMLSRPDFNPNSFVKGISSREWRAINENPFFPMSDKAVAGEYPPGSTFKIVTGAAALETGKITPEELFYDSGKHKLVDIRNADGEVLGWIDFRKALAASDNVYFCELSYRTGIETLVDYAKSFGFGKKTGIDLGGEGDGNLATPEYKMKIFKEDWFLGDTFNAAIGQGFNLATPLQVACMMSAVANNGIRYQPHLVKKIVNSDGSIYKAMEPKVVGMLPVSDYNLSVIKDGLRDVTREGGTASSLASLPVKVAGKTGTAENPQGKDHGWFIAYAPAEKPTVVIAALVEQGGYGSSSAAPIVRDILAYMFAK